MINLNKNRETILQKFIKGCSFGVGTVVTKQQNIPHNEFLIFSTIIPPVSVSLFPINYVIQMLNGRLMMEIIWNSNADSYNYKIK